MVETLPMVRMTQEMLHTQGWTHVVLPYITQQVSQADHIAGNATLSAALRLEAIARKGELLQLLAVLYKRAEMPNPFDQARVALWTSLLPPPAPVPPPVIADMDLPRRRPASAGSVA